VEKRLEIEAKRLQAALLDRCTSSEKYCQFYAAQQALLWAADPESAAAPFNVIAAGKVQPLMRDTPEGSEDCLSAHRPQGFVGTCAPQRWWRRLLRLDGRPH